MFLPVSLLRAKIFKQILNLRKNTTQGETEVYHRVHRVHVSTNLRKLLCWFYSVLMNCAFKLKCRFVSCIYFTIRLQIKIYCHIPYK